ncbi:conjugal transfer protein, TraL family [Pseudomonas chlororaphis]|uniref:conjugal transfer protein, TraL family n=1 Tax=Pseudomonas chlororaphis TaxID=587753 RepID=UPI002D76CA6C|nr:conjugal transfer protein, TraL family [Pseudomonas chlororaphis]
MKTNLTPLNILLNTTHWTLQGKGGVGKSFVSTVFTQYVIERGYNAVCGDTDPVNSTFHRMTALNVMLVPITEGGTVVQRLFDPLFESILGTQDVSIVDNGSSTFLPMGKFISSNFILETMQEHGKQVFIHSIVTGGQAKDDTVTGLLSLIDLVKSSKTNAKIVVWQNEFLGIPEFHGKSLAEMPWIKNNSDIIQGIVTIADRNSDAYATDIRMMSEMHLTCREVMESDQFGLMAKSRIRRVFTDIYDELDRVFGLVQES